MQEKNRASLGEALLKLMSGRGGSGGADALQFEQFFQIDGDAIFI